MHTHTERKSTGRITESGFAAAGDSNFGLPADPSEPQLRAREQGHVQYREYLPRNQEPEREAREGEGPKTWWPGLGYGTCQLCSLPRMALRCTTTNT